MEATQCRVMVQIIMFIFSGLVCETYLDECELKACADGATCVIGVSGATCVCVEGYTGTLCNETINYCTSNPCLNGGNYNNYSNTLFFH